MTRPKIVLYGAGGHGKAVADVVEKQGRYELAGFLDDSLSGEVYGIPVLGGEGELAPIRDSGIRHAIASTGYADMRNTFDERLLAAGFELATAVHPSAQIARGVTLGEGSMIMAGTVVGPDTVLGRSCIVNTCASLDHDCVLGDYVHMAPGANLCGGVRVGTHTLIGIAAAVIPERRIGDRVIIGAGALVLADIPGGATAVGVPARILEKKK